MPVASGKWFRVVIALIAVAVGAMVLGKPYQSLEWLPLVAAVSTVVLWLAGLRAPTSFLGTVFVVVLALVMVLAPYWAVAMAVYGTLVWMMIAGCTRIWEARHRNWRSVAIGIGLVVFGASGFYWLDIASIVLGLLVGPTLIAGGIRVLWRTFVWPSLRRTRGGVVLGRIAAVGLVPIAMIEATLTVKVELSTPALGSFAAYAGPLGSDPGVLLASEPFMGDIPKDTLAYKILYTTTGLEGEITLATGLVILPATVPAGEMPVILWAHGTTGIAPHCAPSLLEDPLGSGAMLFTNRALDQGWAIVAPDYIGLGTRGDGHP